MGDIRGHRTRRFLALLALIGSLATAAAPAAAVGRTDPEIGVVVLLGDTVIEPRAAIEFDCHDRDYPIIRCFHSPAERTQEQASVAASISATSESRTLEVFGLLSPYVRWYRDAGFSGPSFEAYDPYHDLSLIGWNNQISSFVPLNGGHPVWWSGSGFTGTRWDWGTASVSNLGAANDQISSVSKG